MLASRGFTFFTGVPDSTFRDFLLCLEDLDGRGLTNRCAAIERDAIGYAAGYYLATGRFPLAYLQNSGLGNIVNPLTSLADPRVSGIPILLMIGWRGEPGSADEPQHRAMGEITLPLLDLLGVPHAVLPDGAGPAKLALDAAARHLAEAGTCYGLVVRDSTFLPYVPVREEHDEEVLTREAALRLLAAELGEQAVIVASTGKISRELYAVREAAGQGHGADFLVVGAMGLAASTGAEIALQLPGRKVFVFDGDAAVLMSAGALAVIGACAPANLCHIIFDNGCHDSTGGQRSVARGVSWEHLARAHSYRHAAVVHEPDSLLAELACCLARRGPAMLVVKVKKGSRPDLGRPGMSPPENRRIFMRRLKEGT